MGDHREALLNSMESAASGAALSFVARCQGLPVQLQLAADGSAELQQEPPRRRCCPPLFGMLDGTSRLPALIPAGDIIGATARDSDLVIWHAPLATKPGAEKPARRLRRTPPLRLESAGAARQAAAHLRRACCWRGGQAPPRLLVVVNPASGPGKAPAIYERQVRPALEAAGCQVDMHQTRARAHATELVLAAAPGAYDAVVAIGGDGTMHEVLQGMLGRPDWEAMARTPFAQIPCGSGNALAACTDMWSVDTAVHAVVKGVQHAMDIATTLQHAPPSRRFCFLSLNFGLITNLDIGTEHLRWMGGTRFVVGALQQILLKRKHSARVALLEPGGGISGAAGAAGAASAAEGSSGSAEGRALAAGLAAAAAQPGPPVQHLTAFQQIAGQQLPPGWQWLADPEVSLFTATNLPRLDMQFHLAPDATLDSGAFNLIYSPPASRLKGLQLLTASETGEHMHLVQQRLVAAMTLEPRSTGTWLVVDGEAVPFTPLFLEVHPQLCRVIAAPPPAPTPSKLGGGGGGSAGGGSPPPGPRSRKLS